jgi:hypothetical protein
LRAKQEFLKGTRGITGKSPERTGSGRGGSKEEKGRRKGKEVELEGRGEITPPLSFTSTIGVE